MCSTVECINIDGVIKQQFFFNFVYQSKKLKQPSIFIYRPYQELGAVGRILDAGEVRVLASCLVLDQLLLGVKGQDTVGLEARISLEKPFLLSARRRNHRVVG